MLNPAWVGVDPFQDHQAARRFLFHDCDQATAGWAIATQTPWYPEGLSWWRRVAGDRLHAQVIELPGGHCPHLSRPALLAEALITTTSR
jgi:pimeloyl-ACP methyl ester carboxylesterase